MRFDKQISPNLIEVQVYLRLRCDTQMHYPQLSSKITICLSEFILLQCLKDFSEEAYGGLKA